MSRNFGYTGPVFGNKIGNNKKETSGRLYRKQYVPKYSLKQLVKMAEEGVPSVEVERRSRQMKVILHER